MRYGRGKQARWETPSPPQTRRRRGEKERLRDKDNTTTDERKGSCSSHQMDEKTGVVVQYEE